MTLTEAEATVFFLISGDHVSGNYVPGMPVDPAIVRGVSRVLEAVRQTRPEFGSLDVWIADANEVLNGDNMCDLVFRPAAVASAEAALVN